MASASQRKEQIRVSLMMLFSWNAVYILQQTLVYSGESQLFFLLQKAGSSVGLHLRVAQSGAIRATASLLSLVKTLRCPALAQLQGPIKGDKGGVFLANATANPTRKLALESLERHNSYYLLIHPRSLFARHSINKTTKAKLFLSKEMTSSVWDQRQQMGELRETMRQCWLAGEKRPQHSQPSTAKDVVAKGSSVSESEEELLELNQDSTIEFYSTVMFSRLSSSWLKIVQ